jgi:cell wall-associated NlpC family hydrolase
VVVEVAKAIGSNPIDVSGYGRVPVNGQLESVLDTQTDLERVLDISTRRAGDILLLRFSGEPQHLAVLTDNNTIVHSYEAVGKCCEHRLSSVWAARIVRVYRFVGVTQ